MAAEAPTTPVHAGSFFRHPEATPHSLGSASFARDLTDERYITSLHRETQISGFC
jgi:hypothetical protein